MEIQKGVMIWDTFIQIQHLLKLNSLTDTYTLFLSNIQIQHLLKLN